MVNTEKKCSKQLQDALFEKSKEQSVYKIMIDEWDPIPEVNNVPEGSHCTCGHYITREFILTNTLTNLKIVVGSDCIFMYMNGNDRLVENTKEILRKINREERKKKKEEKKKLTHKKCPNCGEYEILIDSQKTKCDKCDKIEKKKIREIEIKKEIDANKILNNRPCVDCKEYNIPKDRESFHVRCYECYQNFKNRKDKIEHDNRPPGKYFKCLKCREYRIPEDKRTWMKLCKTCFFKNR